MRDNVACPSCRALLRLPDEEPSGGMICPRCDAPVPYHTPALSEPAPLRTAPTPPVRVQGEPTAAPPGPSQCPVCRKPVEPDWLFCPHCEAPLRQDGNAGRRPLPNEDSWQTGPSAMILGLRVFGSLALVYFFLGALVLGNVTSLVFGLVTLWCLGLVSAGVMFYRTRHNPSKRNLLRVAAGAITLLGAFVVVGGALALAFCVFVLVSCGRLPF
jgi:Double zinc ribbon